MQQQFQNTSVNLDGLLEILGKNLYSTASVAIRELIQNAHDACERYRIEHEDKEFKIHLSVDNKEKTLTVSDNGSGLTRQEVIDYLATIGSGYTRVLRQQSGADNMIGYFGLGFLSAYVVSDKVEVWTSSYQTPDQSWYFKSSGGKKFTLYEGESHPVGTTVKLHLGGGFDHLSDKQVLHNLISQYCCLLPIPIFLSDSDEAINKLSKPWESNDQASPLRLRQQQLEFAAIFENHFEPITCLPIPNDNELGLSGLIWIQDGGSYASTDNRNVHVFIRNMFISDKEKDLLPSWAGFFGAVLESIHFQPTASRETLQSDEYFRKVKEFLHDFLASELRKLILREPESWRRILRQHNQALLGAAVSDKTLFDAMASYLKVPTIFGDMNAKSILRASGRELYIKSDAESNIQDILFQARNIPLILGYRFAASEFCRLYALTYDIKFHLTGFREFDQGLFEPALVSKDQDQYLSNVFSKEKQEIHFSQFEPDSIPLLIIEDQEVKLKNKIEDDESDRRIGSAALALARFHTNKVSNEVTHHLYLNMSNKLVQRIASERTEKSKLIGELAVLIMTNLTNQGGAERDNDTDHLGEINTQLLQLMGGD